MKTCEKCGGFRGFLFGDDRGLSPCLCDFKKACEPKPKQLRRSIAQWSQCSPVAMSEQSQPAIRFAFEDAQADLLALAKILAGIAYPKRGTQEEVRTLQEWAEIVQKVIPHPDAVEHL